MQHLLRGLLHGEITGSSSGTFGNGDETGATVELTFDTDAYIDCWGEPLDANGCAGFASKEIQVWL